MIRLIQDLWRHLDRDEKLAVVHSPKEFVDWLRKLGLPTELSNIFQLAWPQKSGSVGDFTIYSAPEIMTDEDQPGLIKHGVIKIGSAGNGDFLVINFRDKTPALGLVSHDDFWEAGKFLYEKIADSLVEFLMDAAKRNYLPNDYWVAKEYNELQKQIAEKSPQHQRPR